MKGCKVQEIHLVTGGGGYAGSNLGLALLKKGHRVILMDVADPVNKLPENLTFVKGDVRNYEEVKQAFEGVDCVYHLASYGMSGREMLKKNLIHEVNIKGTENVIKACKKQNLCRLVYTSTFNVVFGGQIIENGDESLPYFPIEKHPDYYSRTKTIAEQKVLGANNCEMSNGKHLKTCALRLAGVYGPGEQRHLPRIVAGQAYFISDGKPVNNFEFFRPLVEGLGYKYPNLSVPIHMIYFFAFITEWLHFIVGRVYNFQPFLTRAEVFKTGVTHWFNLDKARVQLGYIPTVQNDLDSSVLWFLARRHEKNKSKLLKPAKYSWKHFLRDVFLVVIFATLILSFLPLVS